MQYDEFQRHITQMGQELYRDMPWRDDTQPYYVLVSELMLQQTQVARVIPKFQAFIDRFPDISSLATADLAEVLIMWQGLGYNRRAKFLHEAAKRIVRDYDGDFPDMRQAILDLPGVGPNTCGAIEAYAFNRPSLFIETNIRTVFIHHFFSDSAEVADADILERLRQTIDREHPREFYWALMDYGTWLKQNGVRNVSQSRHYKKQAPLEGSVRQVRGRIITRLSVSDAVESELRRDVSADDRYEVALEGLIRDGLVTRRGARIHLTK